MAIRQKTTMTLKYSGEGTSHSRSQTVMGNHTHVIDEPVPRGGTDEGVSPTEAAYSALVGCTNVIGNKCAEKLGIDIGHLSFAMEVDFDRRGVLLMEEVEVPFTNIRLQVTVHGPADQAAIDRVALETEKYCPIAKLYINAGTNLAVTWQKA
ncbi:MAG: OsmC family protein [Aliishimia sp.]